MKYEVSAGAVVFTEVDGVRKYVIICSREGYYGFPKGHIEAGETEIDAALREIYEEVGLQVTILPDFRVVDEHEIPNKKGVIKRIVYFAARYEGQEICYQKEELSDASLMTFDEAMRVFQFENSKRILTEADAFVSRWILNNG